MTKPLTPYFSWKEVSVTKTGLPNKPGRGEEARIYMLAAAVLEPWREEVGRLRVNSWYRSVEVNEAVGGSKTSDHLYGGAADVVPLDMDLDQAWDALVTMMNDTAIPVDQAILYPTHIHVSHTNLHEPRRMFWAKEG